MLKIETIQSNINDHSVEVGILPDFGAAVCSFKVDGNELLYFSQEKLLNEKFFNGCFMMMPTPCRLTDCKYTFEGKEIRQRKNGLDVDIHGLIKDETFQTTKDGDGLVCSIRIDPDHPVYEGYPFPCKFTLTFTPWTP